LYFAGFTGCSAARLARFVRDEEVPGSNPGTPTSFSLLRLSPQLELPLQAQRRDRGTLLVGDLLEVAKALVNPPDRGAQGGFGVQAGVAGQLDDHEEHV